jgi:hypothetical protein
MTQAAALLAQGKQLQASQLGESIIFRGKTHTVHVVADPPEQTLEEGGWARTFTFTLRIPRSFLTEPPRRDERITIRGLQCTVRMANPPAEFSTDFVVRAESLPVAQNTNPTYP